MADLNIRNVPEVLLRRLKSEAVLQGMTLRNYVLNLLQEAQAAKPVEKAIIDSLPRRSGHNKATCRVYGCLMCRMEVK